MAERARHHVDFLMVTLAVVVIIALGAITADSLRAFSATVGVACVVVLLYRAIGTWGQMSRLARALSALLIGNLTVGTIAQFLLIQDSEHEVVPNTVGISLVLAFRFAILGVALFWEGLLNTWPAKSHYVERSRERAGL